MPFANLGSGSSPDQPITLGSLSLSVSQATLPLTPGGVIAAISGQTSGSTITLLGDSNGYFAVQGAQLVGGPNASAARQRFYRLILVETLAGAPASPKPNYVAIQLVGVAPSVTTAPTLSSSSPAVGTPIQATSGVYAGSPPPQITAQQWFYADTGQQVGIGISYTPQLADAGHTLKYVETASNGVGAAVASAAPTTAAVQGGSGPVPVGPTTDFFAADVASTAWYGSAIGYTALHDPVAGKTFIAREALKTPSSGRRVSRVRSYNVNTASWGADYEGIFTGICDDDHGVADLSQVDTTGFLVTTGGTHGLALQIATTTAARDESTLTVRNPVVPPATGALVMGYISGTTLTVTSVISGAIATGQGVVGNTGFLNNNLTANTTISAAGTGTGGVGTYTLSQAPNNQNASLGTSSTPVVFGLTADGYSYPHTTWVSGTGYCFTRRMGGVYSQNTGRMPYGLRTLTLDGNGVPIWSNTDTLVIDFGDNTRCYAGNHVLRGVEVFIPMTRADYGDTMRQDQFLFIYNTQTGAFRNFANTYSTTSFPISLATANANFRVVDQIDSSVYSNIPSIDFDSAGNLSYLYSESASFNATAELTTPAPVYEIVFPAGGGAPSAKVQVGAVKQRYDVYEVAPFGTGMEALVIQRGTNDFIRNGDVYYCQRASGGAWSQSDFYKDNPVFGLDRGTKVKNANAALRWLFAESGQPPGTGTSPTGGATNYASDGGVLRTYAAGGSPLAIVPQPFSLRSDTNSWISRAVAAGGAQPSTAWQKIYDEVFRNLAQAGLSYDAVYLLAAHDKFFTLANLVQTAFNLQVVNAPVLTTGVGASSAVAWKGDGVSGYLNTGFQPSVQTGANLQQNDNWMAAGGLTSEQETNVDISLDAAQASPSGGYYLALCNTSGNARYRACDQGPGLNCPTSTGATFVFGRRTPSGQRNVFVNVGTGDISSGAGQNSAIDTSTASAAVTAAGNIAIFRDNANYSARTLDFFAFGGSGGLGASRTQIGLLRNTRRRYLANIGVTVS